MIKIVWAETYQELTDKVNSLESGWKPLGPIDTKYGLCNIKDHHSITLYKEDSKDRKSIA
jgi:hypothetical protein